MEEIIIGRGESYMMPTGIAFKIPRGHYGQIVARSGLAKAGLIVDGGVIDTRYRGEIHMILVN